MDIPILTGEDIYLKEPFIELCRAHAVDIIHPDLATSGGILETKKIGDVAPGIRRADGDALCGYAGLLHGERPLRGGHGEFPGAGEPFGGCAVVGRSGGWRREADREPGLHHGSREARAWASTLNEEVVQQHLLEPGYFEPTPQWDTEHSHDRLWS